MSPLSRITSVLITLGLAVGAIAGSATAAPRTVTSYYVATNGDDRNPGTLAAPFRTISKARDVVRTRIAAGMTSDIAVNLRGGTYYLDSALRFDERDSGRDGYRITYRNYGQERPTIVGGRRIEGWQPYRDGIYRAPVADGWEFFSLYQGDSRARMARTPNTGFFTFEGTNTTDSAQYFRYRAVDIPAGFDITDAQVVAYTAIRNWSSVRPIAAVDTATRTVTVNPRNDFPYSDSREYFLQGALEFLDQPGEFHLDTDADFLYYKPTSSDIGNLTIIAPTTQRVLEVVGSSAATPVRNLTFEGLSLKLSDFTENFSKPIGVSGAGGTNADPESIRHGLVFLENAEAITIRNCSIVGAGFSGVYLNKHAQNIVIEGNTIDNSGYHGVNLQGWLLGSGGFTSVPAAYVNKHNTVSGNRILNSGVFAIAHGSGIWMYQSGDNLITHNEISGAPRYGVSVKGHIGLTEGQTIYGQVVSFANHWDFLFGRNNTISFNNIHSVMQASSDGGAIESWGSGKNNLIDTNRIHHASRSFGDSYGIYLDDAADYWTIINNVIHDLGDTPVFLKGKYNVFTNNIVANNASDRFLRTYEMVQQSNDNHQYTRNIFYNTDPRAKFVYHFFAYEDDTVAASDNNVVFNQTGLYEVSGIPGEDSWVNWKSLYGGKYDQNSVIADPLFINVAADDYRLRSNSPAYALGFQDINIGAIGPTRAPR